MKRVLALVGAAFLVCGGHGVNRARGGETPLFEHHFVGSQQLGKANGATRLKEILALPSTDKLRQEVLDKLAGAPRRFWAKQLPSGATDHANLIRPLLDDLWTAESYSRIDGEPDRAQSVLAIQLPEARANLWSTNLAQLAGGWKLGAPAATEALGFKGWESKGGERTLRFVRAGKWAVIGYGAPPLEACSEMLEEIQKNKRPAGATGGALLEVRADLPRLGAWFPVFKRYGLSTGTLTILPSEEYVKSEGTIALVAPLPGDRKPWQIPTNIITEPLVSFTAARSVAPFLEKIGLIKALSMKTTPDVFYLWGQSYLYAHFAFAIPVDDPTNALRQLAPRLPKVIQTYMGTLPGTIAWITNKSRIVWQGMPFMMPQMEPALENGISYLVGSTWPRAPQTNLPPPELYQQVSQQKDLLYYDWEITENRLIHGKQLYQLASILERRTMAGTNAPTQFWTLQAGSKLGNTVTEIRQTSPRELSFVRKSHIGFTGFELATLMRWIESPGFPLTFEPPPIITPPKRLKGGAQQPKADKAR